MANPDFPQSTKAVSEDEETERQNMMRRLVYYAAERTLMAWIGSSLALMALGFVIDRFGLIIRQSLPEVGARYYPKIFSFWTGTVLVGLGTLMAVTAVVRYWRFSIAYDRSRSTDPRHGILVGVLYTLLLSVIGLIITVFLIMATD
jgi:putative membrane protein